jgi:hypothetical protein
MMSIDNTYDEAEVREFDERVKKKLDERQPTYVVEPKVDGVSGSLRYEDGALVLCEFTGAFGLAAASCCGPRDWIRIRFLEENSLSMWHPLPRLQYTRRFAPSGTVMSTPRRRVGRSARDALIALRIPTRA